MLLSLRHRFIFIHIYKAAGTSVTHALRPFTRESWFRRRAVPKLPDHITAAELREAIGAVFDECFKFTFVRNPWDWQVSLYHYMKQNRKHPQHALIESMTFPDYIRWRVREDKHLQKEFVTDAAGNVIVDFIGRFENLENDFAEACRRIGIAARLTHRNPSRHDDYRTYYDEETRALVAEHFREDVEMFGYTF
jgi:sulfotransferase famil protein